MDLDEKLEWSALEYEEKEHSPDWFWALGIIVVAVSITFIIYQNYFFAMFIILSGILMAMFSIKKPEMVHYELNQKGLKIKSRLYPYEKIKSFWVQIEKTPTLFIKSERVFMPIISLPIEEGLADKVKNIMLLKEIAEEEMHEHISEKIMESLGF